LSPCERYENDPRHAEDHRRRARVLLDLAVEPQRHLEVLRIADFVGGDERGAEWTRIVERLPLNHWVVAFCRSRALTSLRAV